VSACRHATIRRYGGSIGALHLHALPPAAFLPGSVGTDESARTRTHYTGAFAAFSSAERALVGTLTAGACLFVTFQAYTQHLFRVRGAGQQS